MGSSVALHAVTQGSPNCLGHMRVCTHTQAWLPVGTKGLEASASALFLCVPAHDSKDARKPSGSKWSRDTVPFEHSSSCRVSAWPCPDVRNVPLSWEHLHLSPFLVSLYHSPHPLRSSLPDSVTTSSKSFNVIKVLKRKGKPGTSQALVIVLPAGRTPAGLAPVSALPAGSFAHLCPFHSQLTRDLVLFLSTAHFPAAQRDPLSQVLPDVEYSDHIPIGRHLSSKCPETRKESRTRTQEGRSQTSELGLLEGPGAATMLCSIVSPIRIHLVPGGSLDT